MTNVSLSSSPTGRFPETHRPLLLQNISPRSSLIVFQIYTDLCNAGTQGAYLLPQAVVKKSISSWTYMLMKLILSLIKEKKAVEVTLDKQSLISENEINNYFWRNTAI